MHFTPLLCLAPLLVSSVAAAKLHGRSTTCHRRHHAKPSTSSAASTSASSTSSAAATPHAVVANANVKHPSSHTSWSTTLASSSTSASAPATSSSSSSSSSKWAALNKCSQKKGNICVGWLPDDGSGGGSAQSLPQLSSALGVEGLDAQGWYAQTHANVDFDGSQLTSRMDAIVANGGIFQPAIMPAGSFWGFTKDNNRQAVNVCKVLKQFTDKGMEVWLRWAHEVNWYQTDGTYVGDENDFKEGWAVVAAACKEIAPDVKMWFTPNVADLEVYQKYYPDDPSTVDIIGIDYYPQGSVSSQTFINQMKPFHDAYASETTIFAIGETGLGGAWDVPSQLKWMQAIANEDVSSAMPHMKAVSWFNYDKEVDFRILGKNGDSATKAWLTSG